MHLMIGLLALAGSALGSPVPSEMSATSLNAVLIGWDGAQRNHVKESLARGDLPALRALTAGGALVAIDVVRTTDTKAGWTQILTGLEPETTGVFSNGRYAPIPPGLTIFERLKAAFGPSFATVAVIGKKEHVDADAEQRIPANSNRFKRMRKNGRIGPNQLVTSDGGKPYLLIPAKPFFNAAPTLDVWINGLMLDEKVGAKALELLEKYRDRRFFFFVHFPEVDHKGHPFGENSPEYDAALRSADKWTGRIVEKLKSLGIADQTLVYVTADHGFDEGLKSHGDAPYVFLGTNDRAVIRRGLREDITPTILDRLGVDLATLTPPLDGHPLTKPWTQPVW